MQSTALRTPSLLAALLALAVTACSSGESGDPAIVSSSATPTTTTPTTVDPPCNDPTQMWTFEHCSQSMGPCRSTDGMYYRSNCSNPATQVLASAAPPPTAPSPGVSTPVTPGGTVPMPGVTGVATPPGTGVTPVGVTPVPPATGGPATPPTGVTPTGTVPGPVDTSVAPGPTPGPAPTDTTTPVPGPVTPTTPAGWYSTGDWGGCVVTAVEEAVESSIEPRDFLTTPDGGPYCVKGTVGPQYEDVVILGMELAGDPATADCTAKPLGMAVGERPTVMPTGDGIAVNFVKGGGSGGGGDTGFTWRVQIEGANGSSDENERWCATVTETQGKVFIPYEKFDTQCWYVNADGTKAADYAGAPYTKGTPIAAVSFLVPGTLDSETPFEFCVNGFAPGTSAADAPDGSAVAGDITGTVGDDSADGDYRRVKVTADGHDYIIQNNNWGNESGELVLTYKNNSFQITAGSGNGGDAPASFPSIFIGNNGNTMNGAYSTKPGDKLPIQISSINKIDTHFKWSGSTSVFNATYDVWFASSPPNGRYNDGLNGFVMVWTHAPGGGKQPIGSDIADATIEGHNWDVWVGPRGQGPGGEADLTPDSQAAVVSYVTKDGDINDFQFDLKKFIDNAVGRSGNGSKTFDGSLYLTDVFAGFEIWSGGSGGNLGVDEFTCVVNP